MDHDGSIWLHKIGPIFTWDWDFNYNVSFAGTIQEIINLAKYCHFFGFLSHWLLDENKGMKISNTHGLFGGSPKRSKNGALLVSFWCKYFAAKSRVTNYFKTENRGNTTWMEGTTYCLSCRRLGEFAKVQPSWGQMIRSFDRKTKNIKSPVANWFTWITVMFSLASQFVNPYNNIDGIAV